MNIKLEKIFKKYDNIQVMNDFNIELNDNNITCLLGPSGCGKTTMLNIIAGLVKQDLGDIEGIDNKKISYIFQEDRLLPWATVEENILLILESRYSREEMIKRTEKYLKMVNLDDFRHSYPEQLSGGMKRRVSIARAFAYGGDIVIMDEPFKGLDFELKKKIIEDVLKLWNEEKKMIIFVTHDRDEAILMADDIFLLEGPPLKIKNKITVNIPRDKRKLEYEDIKF